MRASGGRRTWRWDLVLSGSALGAGRDARFVTITQRVDPTDRPAIAVRLVVAGGGGEGSWSRWTEAAVVAAPTGRLGTTVARGIAWRRAYRFRSGRGCGERRVRGRHHRLCVCAGTRARQRVRGLPW